MSHSSVTGNLLCLANRAVNLLFGNCRRLRHTSAHKVSLQPKSEFKPEKVAVVTKTTRYEFEQQRYRYAGLSEEDLKQLVRPHLDTPLKCSVCGCSIGRLVPSTENKLYICCQE